jgi:hypothetical protein
MGGLGDFHRWVLPGTHLKDISYTVTKTDGNYGRPAEKALGAQVAKRVIFTMRGAELSALP